MTLRVAVLASGTGTNLQAILDSVHGQEGIEVVGLGCDKPDALCIERARAVAVDAVVFPAADYPDRAERDRAMADWLEEIGADLVVLAGYMQLLSRDFVARFPNRIVNVHPALLPAFPGLDAIGQALEHGAQVTGVTVHFVDEGVDTGTILLQRAVPVPPDRDRDALEEAIHATEHALLPEAIRLIAAGRVKFDPANPRAVTIADWIRPMSAEAVSGQAADDAAVAAERPLPIRRALISVTDKTGVGEFAAGLERLGVEVISTGGTAAALADAGVSVRSVEEITGQAEILGGRVKTLHPRLHAALLAVRDDPDHMATLEAEGIEPIDLVCVNLYPFERTVARLDVSEAEAVENIDVGGPTMIRAAAKNHRYVAVVVRPESYDAVIAELQDSGGSLSGATRHWLANEAFAATARYDAAISRWFGGRYELFPEHVVTAWEKFLDLSYGENPHQGAALYTEVGARSHVLSRVAKLHGKELSFNNVLDLDSARRLVEEFEAPACTIVKHNNPCGVAIAERIEDAYEKALACDPLSAFGGVIALNREVSVPLAERLHENFVEVLIAPGYTGDALDALTRKEAIRILEGTERRAPTSGDRDVKRVRGGFLVQDADRVDESREEMEVATQAAPSDEQWIDLLFAWKVCRHVRSNAIVLAKDGATIGIGAGQMSRVDSVKIAIDKAHDARGDEAGALLAGSVCASDAFFPFADGPETAIATGARALIQPGGSKRDAEVIAACDAAGAAMVFTGRRHFRH